MIATAPAASGHVSFRQGRPVELEVDHVVVGSGAGGAAAAVVLARAGLEVAICESGPWRDTADYPSTAYGAIRDLLTDWGTLFARGRSMIPVLQASCVGGTTVVNSAIVVRTPGDVLAEWADLGLGDVFTESAVGTAQDEIEQELAVRAMDDAQMAEHGRRMLRALDRRGLEGHPTRRNAPACQGTNQCVQGCRVGAKRSTNLNWIPETIERGGTVLSTARVERILFEGDRAVGVTGRFVLPEHRRRAGRPGARFTVRARRGVVVAASATASAPLLAASGVRLPGLGTGWRGHPGAGIVGVYPDEIRMERGTTQGVASVHFRRSDGIKLESLSLPLEFLAPRLSGVGASLARWIDDIPRMAVWVAVVRAEATGTIRRRRFGPPVVRYGPTAGDLARLRQGAVELARLHFAAGATQVLPGVHGLPDALGPEQLGLLESAPLDNRAWTWVLSHFFGGCVMGADPATSVVGPDLAVRGTRGLSVVDASCLPTTLGVNPQHTIMAVARIVAGRLANQETLRR